MTLRLSAALLCLCGVSVVPLRAQEVPAGPSAKQATATRLSGPAPKVDGRLDDPAWAGAQWLRDFTQKEPVEGGAPAESTAVAFLYDGSALYVGARLDGAAPNDIPAPVTRRDQFSNAEHLIISLDTYHDFRTGYSFVVSSGGVRSDYYHPGDEEDDRDYGFDPVWEARVTRDSAGWTAEMRIPFAQLRFSPGAEQVWGLNINRWMPGRNEDVYWVVIPKSQTGFFSRFGTLRGISGIRPSRRLEVQPYLASDARYTSGTDPRDPFDDGSRYRGRAGLDLKLGLGPNLTLDGTVNPDFGQVEADPAEVNLSAYETFFPERRPFFTEGARLLRGNGPRYFYSRRIGSAPRLFASGDFVDQPDNSTILGAAKVTGRLASGLSLGALTAVTDREEARTLDLTTGLRGRTRVAPRSGFGVVRAQQEFGGSQSTLGFTLTGVARDVGSDPALGAVYSRGAVTGGADWVLRFKGGAYELRGYAGFSHVEGDSTRILALQQASQRYYQRPDQGYLRVDPSRTSLSGYTGGLELSKNAGRHWLYDASVGLESPGFELNDIGQLQAGDDLDFFGQLRYRETSPGRLFHRWSINLGAYQNLDFGGERQFSRVDIGASQTWRGFQHTFLGVYLQPGYASDNLTRGGPLMGSPREAGGDFFFFSGESGNTQWNLDATLQGDEFGGWFARVGAGLSLRPLPSLKLSLDPSFRRGVDTRQYLATEPGGSAATYGSRYIFGAIDQTTLSAQFRANFALSPDLTIEGYVEPFASSGRYDRLGELPSPRSRTLRRYGSGGTTLNRQPDGSYLVTDNGGTDSVLVANPDFRVLSFRSNLVVRWEWHRGSTLFLVWQQDRGDFASSGRRASFGDLFDSATARGTQFLALKLSYWLSPG